MSKAFLLVVISLVTVMMVTAGPFHLVMADPLHCDIEGWPSCYSVGYSNGLANPGTNCPGGHSDNYCAGWDAGARVVNSQTTTPEGCGYGYDNSTCSNSEGCGYGYDNSTCDYNPSPHTPLPGGSSSGLDYGAICQTLQGVLIPPCGTLVNGDGSLTSNGTHAMECIRNGIALAGGATFVLQLPLPLVLKGLSMLAAPSGCSGIVDMSQFDLLSHIGSLSSILKFLS